MKPRAYSLIRLRVGGEAVPAERAARVAAELDRDHRDHAGRDRAFNPAAVLGEHLAREHLDLAAAVVDDVALRKRSSPPSGVALLPFSPSQGACIAAAAAPGAHVSAARRAAAGEEAAAHGRTVAKPRDAARRVGSSSALAQPGREAGRVAADASPSSRWSSSPTRVALVLDQRIRARIRRPRPRRPSTRHAPAPVEHRPHAAGLVGAAVCARLILGRRPSSAPGRPRRAAARAARLDARAAPRSPARTRRRRPRRSGSRTARRARHT